MEMHRTTSSFPSTSDRFLLPLTMQVISLPFFYILLLEVPTYSGHFTWHLANVHSVLQDSYSAAKPSWILSNSHSTSSSSPMWETTRLCKHGDHELCSRSWKMLVEVYSRNKFQANTPSPLCLKIHCSMQKVGGGLFLRTYSNNYKGITKHMNSGTISTLLPSVTTVGTGWYHSLYLQHWTMSGSV